MDYYDLLADWDANYQQDARQEQPAAEQTHPLSHDSLFTTSTEVPGDVAGADDAGAPEFTEREWARLRFLRELVRSGQVSEWELTPADQAVRSFPA